MLDAFLGGFLTCAVPPDPEGAADFVAATTGVPTKTLAGWMRVCESQITRWRQGGNVPNGRLRMLLKVTGEEAEPAAEALRRYRELQARRDGALVIERSAILAGVEAFAAFLAAAGWRPVAVKASLEPQEGGSLIGCRKRVSSAA